MSKVSPVGRFVEIVRALREDPRQVAQKIGYSPGVYNSWVRRGKVPKVAVIAARSLLPQTAKPERVFIVRAGGYEDILRGLLSSLGLEYIEV